MWVLLDFLGELVGCLVEVEAVDFLWWAVY